MLNLFLIKMEGKFLNIFLKIKHFRFDFRRANLIQFMSLSDWKEPFKD